MLVARRSDHSPEALRALLVEKGHAVMAERGFAGFSAREAARRAGYAVGTIYHLFGALDAYLLAINTVTVARWAAWLEQALAACPDGGDRIDALVRAYFAFADANTNAWMAIYDHRRPRELPPHHADIAERIHLMSIVDREVARALGRAVNEETKRLARSLVAGVHGHCVLHLSGSFALLDEEDPLSQAVARTHESLAAHRLSENSRD